MILILLLVLIVSNPERAVAATPENNTSKLVIGVLTVHARNRESNSSLIGLRHLLDEVGVPYHVIDPDTLTRPDIVKVYPAIILDSYLNSGTLYSNEVLAARKYVKVGGVLIAVKPDLPALAPVFGFSSRRMMDKGFFIRWRTETPSTNILQYFDKPEERLTGLTSGRNVSETMSIVTFAPTTAEPLADFLDHDGVELGPGILRNTYGQGVTYSLGVGWTDSILTFERRGLIRPTNVWQPDADIIRLLVLSALQNDVPKIVIKNTVPFGYRSALLLTHDVDARSAYDTWAIDMAQMERTYGVKATYFLTTRYFSDNMDRAYWNPQTAQRLRMLGMNIGSHGVTHYENFTQFPIGDNLETQATYIPHSNPTLTGEIRVSAEILREYGTVDGWRSPGLLSHQYLDFALERNGYEFRSIYTAASAGTNYPYIAMLNQSLNHESSIFEFPLALGDIGLSTTNLYSYVDLWKEIIIRNRENGVPTTILIHPTSAAKVKAGEEIIRWALVEGDIWVTDLASFAQFWKLRHKTTLEVKLVHDTYLVNVTNPENSALEGLSLAVPELGTLQLPPIPPQTSLSQSISPSKAKELMMLDATRVIDVTETSIQEFEIEGKESSTAAEIALAKEKLALARQALQTSPNEALKHARVGQAHLTLALAAEHEAQDESSEKPGELETVLNELFDTIDYILMATILIIYGGILILTRRRRIKNV